MNIKYDKKQDAVYITLSKGRYGLSKKITDCVIVDFTQKGQVIGIEILDAKENLKYFNPSKLGSSYQLSI